jgi:hypothetical protein
VVWGPKRLFWAQPAKGKASNIVAKIILTRYADMNFPFRKIFSEDRLWAFSYACGAASKPPPQAESTSA